MICYLQLGRMTREVLAQRIKNAVSGSPFAKQDGIKKAITRCPRLCVWLSVRYA